MKKAKYSQTAEVAVAYPYQRMNCRYSPPCPDQVLVPGLQHKQRGTPSTQRILRESVFTNCAIIR